MVDKHETILFELLQTTQDIQRVQGESTAEIRHLKAAVNALETHLVFGNGKDSVLVRTAKLEELIPKIDRISAKLDTISEWKIQYDERALKEAARHSGRAQMIVALVAFLGSVVASFIALFKHG